MTPAVTPQPDQQAAEPTLAQRIRAKFPGEYDDMDDPTLEGKVLAKYPEYSDLPRTPPPPKSTAEIRATPTGVLPWLKGLENDVRYGTGNTAPGRALQFLGAKGTNVGESAGAADTVASPILGPIKAAQGVAQLPSHPWEGAKKIAGGALQAATLPSAFLGGPTAAKAIPEMADQAGASLYKNLPFLGKAFASESRAGQNFQQVMGAAKDAAVPITDNLSQNLTRYQQLVDAGGSRSLSVNKLLTRVTDPSKGVLTYKEARDFYSNISRLSADEAQRLTPVMKQQVGAIRAALGEAISGTAEGAGQGKQYGQAMQEYRDAKQMQDVGQQVKKVAARTGLAALGGGAAAVGAKETYNYLKKP